MEWVSGEQEAVSGTPRLAFILAAHHLPLTAHCSLLTAHQ